MTKKCVRLGLFSVAFLLASSLAHAQVLVVPQVVDGGAWLTTIAITNTGATQTVVSLSFFQEIPGGGGATSSWSLAFVENVQAAAVVLPPGSTLFLHTPGTAANTTVGWGQINELDGSGVVVAYAIFTARGASLQNGTAPASAAVSRILVPFDNVGGAATSMAIVNTTSSSETINVGIRTSAGISQPSAITLPAQGHTSFDFPTKFGAAVAGLSGLAEFYSPSGSFSILALRFQSGAFTTAPVYSATGPPLIASSSSGGGGGAGNIIMAGFAIAKVVNGTGGSLPPDATTDLLGGQFASYTPAEWQLPFAAPTFGPCSVLDVTTPAGGKVPYGPDAFLDAGTISVTGQNLPPNFTLTKTPLSTGPFYSLPFTSAPTLAYGGIYTISSTGGPQVGPFSISATLPTSFTVTNWDAITSINRANGLTLNWTGNGFDTVIISITTSTLGGNNHSVTVACIVPAGPGTFAVPQQALATLLAVQSGSANSVGQLTVSAAVASPGGTGTAVSSTAQTLVPTLVGGGQVNYGSFTPSLVVLKTLSVQ
ncbi:MAG TPA: hypothetical protein VG096_22885 [Bryobacteraceae bacterium]|jgi:hypothetical protein|nr:hypothetical protein [Bryobacteraceae bacterium]